VNSRAPRVARASTRRLASRDTKKAAMARVVAARIGRVVTLALTLVFVRESGRTRIGKQDLKRTQRAFPAGSAARGCEVVHRASPRALPSV